MDVVDHGVNLTSTGVGKIVDNSVSRAHAKEVTATNIKANQVFDYLAYEGGAGDLKNKLASTGKGLLAGDKKAYADTVEFGASMLGGGSFAKARVLAPAEKAIVNLSKNVAKTTAVTIKESAGRVGVAAKKISTQVKKNAPRLNQVVKQELHSTGSAKITIHADNNSITGHAWITLERAGASKNVSGVSMEGYRGKRDLGKALLGKNNQVMHGDIGISNTTRSKTYTITDSQALAAEKRINRHSQEVVEGRKYKLASDQCATFACDILKAAGQKPPKSGIITNPKSIWKNLSE